MPRKSWHPGSKCVYDDDPERHFAKGGVIEALDEAKKAGKVRYVGFTGHKRPAIHLKMLSYDYPFDSVQMPLNPFDATYHSFETSVLPEVSRRGMAALGMKSLRPPDLRIAWVDGRWAYVLPELGFGRSLSERTRMRGGKWKWYLS